MANIIFPHGVPSNWIKVKLGKDYSYTNLYKEWCVRNLLVSDWYYYIWFNEYRFRNSSDATAFKLTFGL